MLIIATHLIAWWGVCRLLCVCTKHRLVLGSLAAIACATAIPSLAWNVAFFPHIARFLLNIGSILPFVLIGMLLFRRWVAERSRWAIVRWFALGVATCMVLKLATWIVVPTPRQALPIFATSIREETNVNGFLPDFSYKLEADVRATAFLQFVKRMGFSPGSKRSAVLYEEGTPGDRYRRRVEYRDGRLYYDEGQT